MHSLNKHPHSWAVTEKPFSGCVCDMPSRNVSMDALSGRAVFFIPPERYQLVLLRAWVDSGHPLSSTWLLPHPAASLLPSLMMLYSVLQHICLAVSSKSSLFISPSPLSFWVLVILSWTPFPSYFIPFSWFNLIHPHPTDSIFIYNLKTLESMFLVQTSFSSSRLLNQTTSQKPPLECVIGTWNLRCKN